MTVMKVIVGGGRGVIRSGSGDSDRIFVGLGKCVIELQIN